MTYQQKITFGEMRESGVRDALIYCRDHHCSHHVEANADGWPDHPVATIPACTGTASRPSAATTQAVSRRSGPVCQIEPATMQNRN